MLLHKCRTTIPKGSTPKQVETDTPLTGNAEGFDIVYSAWQHAAVHLTFVSENEYGNSEPC